MKVYAIYDKRNCEFFKNGAKGVWLSKGAAKNALLLKFGANKDNWKEKYYEDELWEDWIASQEYRRRYLTFSDQKRFECREYDLQTFYEIV